MALKFYAMEMVENVGGRVLAKEEANSEASTIPISGPLPVDWWYSSPPSGSPLVSTLVDRQYPPSLLEPPLAGW